MNLDGGNDMPEYGPFIEYCCETYVHHSVIGIVMIAMAAVSVIGMTTVGVLVHHFTKSGS